MSLSKDLETCVLRTEAMLFAWTEFAYKYSKENVKLDVSIYRERLTSAFKKFDEISQEVDKIVFCSVDESSNLVTELSRSEVTTTISPPPVRLAEFVDKVNSPNLSADSSSSGEMSQNPADLVIVPNVKISDLRLNARHLSPAHKNEVRFKALRDTVVSDHGEKSPARVTGLGAIEDTAFIDLTVDEPLLFEIDQVCSVDVGVANKSTNSTSVEDTEHADLVTNLLASASAAKISEGSITPLSEQLFLSDEELEDTNKCSKTEVNSQYLNRRPYAASQPEFILSPRSQTNTQSFFDLSCRNSRVTLSVPNKAPKDYKNKNNVFSKFADKKKRTPIYAKDLRRVFTETFETS